MQPPRARAVRAAIRVFHDKISLSFSMLTTTEARKLL